MGSAVRSFALEISRGSGRTPIYQLWRQFTHSAQHIDVGGDVTGELASVHRIEFSRRTN
jgi:hypothetical protein